MRHATSPQPGPVATVVIGGDASWHDRAARLLERASFSVDDYARVPKLVLLLLSQATDAERVGEVRTFAECHPEACVLAVVPADASNASMRRILLAGAAGIVLDDELEQTLVPTACAMLAGQLTVPAALVRQIAPRPLSHREKQVLALVMRGHTNREIAQDLYLAESTVKTHLSSAFRKLDARSRSEAVTRITDPDGGYGARILEITNDSLAASR